MTRRWGRYVTLVGFIVGVLLLCSPSQAFADLGNAGPGPSPGLCDYPAVCGSGVDGALVNGFYYWEDFPVELNGSHRHCEWGGGQTYGNLGVSMMLQAGISGPIGAVNGSCFYVCPDMQQAAMPNPPGGWKDAIVPTKCQPVGRNPFLPPPPPEDVPIAPPIAEQGAVPALPFGEAPQPPPPPWEVPPPPLESPPLVAPGGVTPPPAERLPSVTNPRCPNPDATVTKACGN